MINMATEKFDAYCLGGGVELVSTTGQVRF